MKPAQLMNRFKLASLVVLGLAFNANAQAQTVARSNDMGTYSSSQVPRGDYRSRPATQQSVHQQSMRSGPSQIVRNNAGHPASTPKTASPRSSNALQHASYDGADSSYETGVELASCSSCQSGNGSHAHHAQNVEMDYGSSYDSDPYYGDHASVHGRLRRPGSYQFQGNYLGADSCGPCGDPALGILGALLVHSQIRVAAATFWGDGQDVAPLVTTSAQNPINLDTAGTLNDSLRRNLFGGEEMLGGGVQGFRGEIGLFTDPCRTGGVMLRMFDAGNNSDSYTSVSGTNGFIARPFVDGATQETLIVNHGSQVIGNVSAAINSDVYGGDILLRKAFHAEQFARFEWLLGYQMMRLEEGLHVDSTSGQNGVSARVRDSFETSNRFHGAAIGLNMHLSDNCWSFNTMLKLGIGNNDREVDIAGSTDFTGSTSSSSPNGLLARNTNAGHYTHSTLVAVPELEMNLGYKITPRLEAIVGYSFLTLPKAAQVANQIDPSLQVNLGAGGPAPRFSLSESNYSLHSLSYGVQYRY